MVSHHFRNYTPAIYPAIHGFSRVKANPREIGLEITKGPAYISLQNNQVDCEKIMIIFGYSFVYSTFKITYY
jgi:hypothetical protein